MEEGMSAFCIQTTDQPATRTRAAASYGAGCGGGGGGGLPSSGTKCGRWNPTAEQVKVLTDLFRSGLRTPSTDQIQKISNQLSFYGKIESKNVFYWFQNHKARERQKRRRVSKDHLHDAPPCFQPDDHLNKPLPPTRYFGEINQIPCEPERAIETLQLFPLNSFNEKETDKFMMLSNEYKENHMTFAAYTCGREIEHPPLDLRLSFF